MSPKIHELLINLQKVVVKFKANVMRGDKGLQVPTETSAVEERAKIRTI